MSLAIRFAERKDVPAVLEFIMKLARYEKLETSVVATEAILEEELFDKGGAEALLAEEDGIPVGFALFFHNFSTFRGRRGIYLEDLFVDQEKRGRGYGKALFQALAQLALDRRCDRLDWSVLDWNAPSIAFYRSLGANSLDEWTGFRLTGSPLAALAQGLPAATGDATRQRTEEEASPVGHS